MEFQSACCRLVVIFGLSVCVASFASDSKRKENPAEAATDIVRCAAGIAASGVFDAGTTQNESHSEWEGIISAVDPRIPRLPDGNGNVRPIAGGDFVFLNTYIGGVNLAGRIVGFQENPHDKSRLLIGIFDSLYSSTVTAIDAGLVRCERSYIAAGIPDDEWAACEKQVTLPIGPPIVNGQRKPVHSLVFYFLKGTSAYGIDGTVLNLQELPAPVPPPTAPDGRPLLLSPGTPTAIAKANTQALSTEVLGDPRPRRRIRKGDILVYRRMGETKVGIVANISFDPQSVTGHRLKILKLEDWEYFFEHGAPAWEEEIFGMTLDGSPESNYILPLDWTRSKGREPLANILKRLGLIGHLPRP